MSPSDVMPIPKPSTTNDITGNRRPATVSAQWPIWSSWSSSFASSASTAQMVMNRPPPTQTTAAPTWSILKTKYQDVFAAKTIETTMSATAISDVAMTDVRRRLSAAAATTTCSIPGPLPRTNDSGRGGILTGLPDGYYPLRGAAAVVRTELFLKRLLQLVALRKLLHYVGAADQFAADEDLRDRRPARDRRELLADSGVGQDVHRRHRRAGTAERIKRSRGVAAHDELGRAFHEEGDILRLDHVLDLLAKLAH